MMADTTKIARKEVSFSEAIVDGLYAGVLAGLVMAALLALMALLRSESLGALFTRFDPTPAAAPLKGFLLHLAVSGVYGIIYGLIWFLVSISPRTAPRTWQAVLLGAVYAAGLFFLGWMILLPASGSSLRQLPWWDLGLAHLAYGAALGYLVYRRGLDR
ncbi:MAG: hypothetical protein A2W36_02290 [Chloroflexi bacterium RBG_16_58_14]|nr:MAG: hypothetical protein A2W36_02290 [Chloroflexi bacterium RBG_16_58_14]